MFLYRRTTTIQVGHSRKRKEFGSQPPNRMGNGHLRRSLVLPFIFRLVLCLPKTLKVSCVRGDLDSPETSTTLFMCIGIRETLRERLPNPYLVTRRTQGTSVKIVDQRGLDVSYSTRLYYVRLYWGCFFYFLYNRRGFFSSSIMRTSTTLRPSSSRYVY